MQNVKNIIFDLGGVILNLDFKKTELGFAGLGIGNFNQYYTLQTVTPIFEDLEIGKISSQDFYTAFRKIVGLDIKDDDIALAWNAMLLDFPAERINRIKELGKKYNIYLLSNTNEIHHTALMKIFRQQIGDYNLDDLFIKAYYSHKLGLRKPGKEIFETVLKDANLKAEETLFIDDSAANIETAKVLGLQAIHLPTPKTILELDL